MQKLYIDGNDKFIVYNKLPLKHKAPYVIFLHGFMSHRNGAKAMYIQNYCQVKGYNFIRFDNFGHGESSGKLIEQNVGSWLQGIYAVLDTLVDGPAYLVGSSLGGWLSLLAAKGRPELTKGVIGLAAAVDFTEELIYDKLSATQREFLKQVGMLEIPCSDKERNIIYPITYDLINEARQYLLLRGEGQAEFHCPLHLIHGIEDRDVPYELSMRLAAKVNSGNIVLKFIKDGGHRLARPEDLRIIAGSLDEIITC